MRLPGGPEVFFLFLIVILLFGVGRISKIAGEIGSGIRAFKKGLQSGDEEEQDDEATSGSE